MEIGVKAVDSGSLDQLESNRILLLEVLFEPPQPAFNLQDYQVPNLACNEDAANWAMPLPPIFYEDVQSVDVELLGQDVGGG